MAGRDRMDQPVAIHDHAGIGDEDAQKLKLAACEVQVFTIPPRQAALRNVEAEAAKGKHPAVKMLDHHRPSQKVLNPR